MAEILSCHCFDLFNNVGISSDNESIEPHYLEDGLHPNIYGQQLLAKYISNQLRTLFV